MLKGQLGSGSVLVNFDELPIRTEASNTDFSMRGHLIHAASPWHLR
jgi:hypothetical protein